MIKITRLERGSTFDDTIHHLFNELRITKEVYCQYHSLAPDQGFPIHWHATTNEWTIVYDAEFDVVTRDGTIIKVQIVRSFNRSTIIYIPIGTCHTIRSRRSNFKYAVIKDGLDDFCWC